MILFSHDIFSAQRAGGVSRCMIELMRALALQITDWSVWGGVHANEFLQAASTEPWVQRHIQARYAPERGTGRITGALRNELGFQKAVRICQASIVHRSYHPVVDLTKAVSRVETVHDMWDERANGWASNLKSLLKRRAVGRADHIICVSNSTRNELLDIWPQLENRVVVIPHGVRRLSDTPIRPVISRPYFLFVGRRDLYKNFAVAVEALRISGLKDIDLVCFGGGSLSENEQRLVQDAKLGSRVFQWTGDDAHLAGLYENATALLYPSSYEGFGLPILEAMVHGCPVIAAPLTSLPEVGGNAAAYADPARPEEWAAKMKDCVLSVDRSSELRRQGLIRADHFSWTRSAELHLELYRKAA